MSTVKGIANNVLNGYNDTIVRLAQRYSSAVSAIDKEHNAKNAEIKREAEERKNSADASGKVALSNTKRAMLDKGLSKSGASVQAELDSNLARNNAFSEIEEGASRERADNETARARSKSSALAEFVDAINTVESKKNEAYISQLNKDREYEADREDEIFKRYVENRAYEAEREDERFDRYAENREFEADREDERFDRYAENREFEAEREDERFDRYAENREFEAAREDEAYDRYADSREFEAAREDEAYDRYAENREFEAGRKDELYRRSTDGKETTGEKSDKGDSVSVGVEPEMSPKVLVDKIKSHYENKYYNKDNIGRASIRKAIETIINDKELTYEYRYQVKMYAVALGLY